MNVKEMINVTVGIVILAIIFTAMYPLIGGATGVVATTWTNATSPGYVGTTLAPVADLIPTLYVIAVIVGVVLALAATFTSGTGKARGRW